MTALRGLAHVLADCDDTTLDFVVRLVERAGRWGWRQHVVCLEPRLVGRLRRRLGCPVHVAASRLGWATLDALSLRRCVADWQLGVMLAWGEAAAATCRAARPDVAAAVVLREAMPKARISRWVQAVVDGDTTLVACSQLVQRRVVEGGADPRQCRLIRPPVDLRRLRSVDGERVAKELAVPSGLPVLLMPPVSDRGGGHRYGLWAAALLGKTWREIRVVVPGRSQEQRRLRRFAEAVRLDEMALFTGDRYEWPELLAAADVLVVPATDDIDVTPLAWAMAAGIPIIGSATAAVQELIAPGRTGWLAEPRALTSLTSLVLQVIGEESARRRIVEQARGLAYELFGGSVFDAAFQELFEQMARRGPRLAGRQRLAEVG